MKYKLLSIFCMLPIMANANGFRHDQNCNNEVILYSYFASTAPALTAYYGTNCFSDDSDHESTDISNSSFTINCKHFDSTVYPNYMDVSGYDTSASGLSYQEVTIDNVTIANCELVSMSNKNNHRTFVFNCFSKAPF